MHFNCNILHSHFKKYLTNTFQDNLSILEVGCNDGAFNDIKHYFNNLDGLESNENLISDYNLHKKYRRVYSSNVLDFDYEYYDIVYINNFKFNDEEECIKVINKFSKCKYLFINCNDDFILKNIDKFNLSVIEFESVKLEAKIDFGGKSYSNCILTKKQGPRVVVTLSTVPNRLSNNEEGRGIKPGLDSIINQSYKGFEIHINIPYFNNKSKELYVIPEWLLEYEKKGFVKIFRTHDFGSITKLVPTIMRLSDPEDIIIIVDDDILYMDGFVEYHINKRRDSNYTNAAIGFAGLGGINADCHFCTTMEKNTRVKILEGYKTISVKRSFFKEDYLYEMIGEEHGKSWNDDMIISAYLGKHNIEKYVLNYEYDTDFKPRVESFPIIRAVPNEHGGVNWYRHEKTPDNNEKYYKLGWLEK
jgi:hypothetical protein